MDAGLLSLEEHFSTFYVEEELDDPPSSDDNNRNYFNEWDDERELNGDIGLIPGSSSFAEPLKDISDITDCPTSVFFQKMIDWNGLLCADTFPHEELPHQEEEVDIKNFDLASYITEPSNNKTIKSVGKKIDKEKQTYIIEVKSEKLDTSDEVDVETVFEEGSLPVLEANDAFGLLEQFEASEKPILPNAKSSSNDSFGFSSSLATNIEMEVHRIPASPVDIFEDTKHKEFIDSGQNNTNKDAKTDVKTKQILEALPQELIARINESGKRKPITVIPPIPNKRRASSRTSDISRNKLQKVTNDKINLDHDYCAPNSPYPKEPRKDSGFQSAEEDERTIIRNQPTVKTADGKLMVSLLKVNTIRTNACIQKKKLNLEEYKKRRFISSNTTSQSNSPASSTCSSPLPEDENLKRLKHQEKLMKMAADLLNTPAKCSKPVEIPAKPVVPTEIPLPKKVIPPSDLEVKTYVSIATNTDISSINCSKSIMASSKQLEEIKPLLQKVSDKINSSSFITSLIENIPKVKTKATPYFKSKEEEVVREDKIIHYLKKDRDPVKTDSVACQTDFKEDADDTDTQTRYRRRIDGRRRSSSSSSRSSSHSNRRRRKPRSNSSHSSRSSSSNSRSSRSRSRSVSPKRRQYSAEHLKEVEERRVIYVGRISSGTTKDELRRRFGSFGAITNVSLHFRDYGDNYGFVTFVNKEDAYEAVEHGNDHVYPKYDLSFGGRRIFCKTSYSDLDNMREEEGNYYNSRASEDSFDALLRAAQEKLRKRKP